MNARRRANARRLTERDLLGAALLAWMLPGCPLSDHYYLDATAGGAGVAAVTGGAGPSAGMAGAALATAGSDMTGGMPPAGGSAGAAIIGDGGTGGIAGTAPSGSGTAGSVTGGAGGTDLGGTGGAETGGTSDTGGAPEGGGAGMPPDCVPTPEVCDGVSNDCDAEVNEGAVCPAGCAARTYENHVYVLCMSSRVAARVNYAAAGARCEGLGTELGLGLDFELGFIESATENALLKDWITTTAPAPGMVWIGANDIDQENTWVWGPGPDAEQFFTGSSQGGGTPYLGRYNDFDSGRPNSSNGTDEDCGVFDSAANWDWNDLRCTEAEMGFLCEENP